jgi:hypothetical protein
MPTSEALRKFYTGIFSGVRRRRALSYAPSDVTRYKRHGLVPIRKLDGDDVAVDDDAVRRLIEQDDEADNDDEREQVEQTKHLVSTLADLIAEGSEGRTDRPAALRHLLFNRDGQALVHRMRRAKRLERRKENAMTKWEDIAKAEGGADAIVAHVLKGDTSLDQQALTKHLTTAAQRQYPALRPDAAFAKAFEANESWRRAMLSVRGF